MTTSSYSRQSNTNSENVCQLHSIGGETLRSSSTNEGTEPKTIISTESDFCKTGRAALIEFKEGGQTAQQSLSSTEDIQKSLTRNNDTAAHRRLYLLEGPHPDHASTLEKHFKVPQSFFRKHKRSSKREMNHRASETPPLPSLIDPQKTWCLDYHALRLFEHEWKSNWVRCAENGRRLELSRINGDLDETGIIGRKASYWSKIHENGGWDAIIVVDESVENILVGGPDEPYEKIPVQSRAYQGGYRNFVDNTDDQEPPRTSIFDDIVHYCVHHSSMLKIGGDPLASTIFLQKIVASHYMTLIKYVKSLLNHLAFRLSQRTKLGDLNTDWVEHGWSDLQVWNWRCNKYCQRVEAIMNSLGIEEDSQPQPTDNMASCAKDFIRIHRHLVTLRQRSETLASDFNGVAIIVLNREALKEANRSIQEARSVRVLTLLGMLFLPLSFASSLLSMAKDYLPGAEKFWIYLSIAVPLILFVVFLAVLVSLGYFSDQSWIAKRLDVLRKRREAGEPGVSEKGPAIELRTEVSPTIYLGEEEDGGLISLSEKAGNSAIGGALAP